MKKLLFYLFLALGFAACRKDMEETIITDTVYTPPVIKVNGSLAGQVTDEGGQAVEGAIVKLGSLQQTTGADGFFIFRNVVLDANGTFVKVDQPGYFHSSTRIFPKPNTENYVRLTLMPRQTSGEVNGATGGTVTLNSGARIKLPANGIINADGSPYNGDVLVAARWLNPADRGMASVMPGNLQGINSDREEVSLASYGMLAVELNSPGGDRLNLGLGATAELTFPIPAALRSSAPATIPLWYFDENTGLWREEGNATRQGDNYVGSVSHFSFWNCDYPFPLVNIEGQLLSTAGNPITNTLVMIEMTSTSQVGSGLTNNDGVFTGKVPAGEALVLRIMNQCGEVAYEQPIGPFTADANLGEIVLSSLSAPISNISGTLVNCDGEPLAGGLLRITNEWGGTHFILADANGQFNKAIIYCNSFEISLKGYDLANNVESNEYEFPIAPDVDAGVISVCANTITEYIRVQLNGEEYTYLEPLLSGTPGALYEIGSYTQDSTYTFEFTFPVGAPGVYNGAGVRFTYFVLEPAYFGGYCFNPCNSMTVTITEFGAVGEFVRGTFSGTMDFHNNNQQEFPDTPISGEFAVIRTQ